jgi:glucosamine--fructose-6-phosphate aminotransferase (isomerizing)
MLAEIAEQPAAIRATIAAFSNGHGLDPAFEAQVQGWLHKREGIMIAASGSSRHVGIFGQAVIENIAGVPVEVVVSSDYALRTGPDLRALSVMVISQSGETADTLASLRRAKRQALSTLAITNVAGATMLKEAEIGLLSPAGTEYAIPATKSVMAQLVLTHMIALAAIDPTVPDRATIIARHLTALGAAATAMEEALLYWTQAAEQLAEMLDGSNSMLLLGRGPSYFSAVEGALKLKESAYVHAEALPTGELKHGPLAMVDDDVVLIFAATVDLGSAASVQRYEQTLALLDECAGRWPRLVVVANDGDAERASKHPHVIFVPQVPEYCLPLLELVFLQLLACALAVRRGIQPDRPRHLVKSVRE